MKYLILIAFILSIGSIATGFLFELNFSEKLIGFGTVGLFMITFPLFIYYRWSKRSLKDYMITKENLEKMREYRDNEQINN